MGQITVTNLSKKTEAIELPHQVVCVKAGRCFCNRDTKTSFVYHLPSNKAVKGVDEAILLSPHFQLLEKQKLVKILRPKTEKTKASKGKGKTGKGSSHRKKKGD